MKPSEDDQALQQASTSLDALLGHRVRLTVCALLSRYDTMDFRRLKSLTEETDGSLGAHLKRLEEAEYLKVRKGYRGKRPVSWYRLSASGRAALERHLEALARLTGMLPGGD